MHLCREIRPPNKCPVYDIRPSDGDASALKIWGMWSCPSLPLLPGPPCLGVVASDRVQFIGQIKQIICANK